MKDREMIRDDSLKDGEYAEVLYLDEDGEPTDKDHAVEWIIRRYRADGTMFRENRTGSHGY